MAAFTEQVRERFGRVDVLVNNAGISFIAPAEDTVAEQWRRVLEVNLTGPFLLAQSFGRMMLQAGVGSIVNVASIRRACRRWPIVPLTRPASKFFGPSP